MKETQKTLIISYCKKHSLNYEETICPICYFELIQSREDDII